MFIVFDDLYIEDNLEADGYKLILATHEDSAKALEIAGIKPHTSAGDAAEAKTARFESMDAYDYASFLTPDTPRGGTVPSFVEIFLNRDYLLVFGEAFLLGKIKDEVEGKQSKHLYFEQTFVSLYEHFLKKDQLVIETIEDEIEKLEERTTQKKPEDHTAAIISLRKRLLALDRYYKAVYDVFEGLEENQNGFYSSKQIKLFGVYKNKIDRIILDILNQREYLTQVREAFQNQLDISLNETMRFFTVVTSIFLPLTLLVGWYGMNLRMPEFASNHAYPIVIAFSILFIILSLIFSKKKGWL